MKLPRMKEIAVQRSMIDVFKGYNHNLRIGENEFYDMENLTSTSYPVLSPRGKRGEYKTANPESPQALIQKDALCYVDGTDFVINGYRVNMDLSVDPDDCPKQLVSMGAYVIILPDKKYIKIITNKGDGSDYEFGNIEATVSTVDTVRFEMCKVDGSYYENTVTSVSEPTITEEMESGDEQIPYWIDTSTTPHSLKQYSTSLFCWTAVATSYVKITSSGIGKPFEVGDGVTISGIEIEQLSDLNNTMIIWGKGDDYIIVTGIIDAVATQNKTVMVSRRMPNMDFVIESENRLWGCRYGVALNGEVVNEIYASKLGDFKNWNCFAGVSTDSYAVTVGTDGQFTGAITHLGYPLFFKENFVHKVYGNYPANYQITTTACRGVQKGSHKSLAIVNEVLYYKSRSAVCAYDGSLPQEISYGLGEVAYEKAVAGSHANKYYISMQESDTGKWHLFVYDASKGMWHREDSTRAVDFCSCRGEMYYIDHADSKIKTVHGSGDPFESEVEWMAETGLIGTDSPDRKYVSKLNIRMSLELGAQMRVYIQYDSYGDWEHISSAVGHTIDSFTVHIRPRRCDHLRLRFEGEGECKIFSITKTIEQGSDR